MKTAGRSASRWKFFAPSSDIMVETAKAPKHNILTECDFSHLDQKLKEKPQIGTIALSGVVCYLNNKTPEFIDSIPAEEKRK